MDQLKSDQLKSQQEAVAKHKKEIDNFKKNIHDLEKEVKTKQEKIIKAQEAKDQVLTELKDEKLKHEQKVFQLQKKLDKSLEQNRQMIINQSKIIANTLGPDTMNRNSVGNKSLGNSIQGMHNLTEDNRHYLAGSRSSTQAHANLIADYSDLNNSNSHGDSGRK